MSKLRKFISMSAIAMLGVTNMLTPLSYASAATGYDALGPSDLEGEEHAALRFIMPDRDVYLYAVTAANHYYVIYNGNTHTSGTMPTGEFIYDTTGHLIPNAFAKTGYTWKSWNTKTGGDGTSYASGAEVLNWTTEEDGEVPIYAQWDPNTYNISYNLNDNDGGTSSGVHTKTPKTGEYDQSLTIQHPSRTGYAFSGWDITNMDTEIHEIGSGTSTSETETEVMEKIFKNLRATSGTVTFTAKWSKNQHTPYTVEHYLQTLTGGYPEMYEDIDNLSGVTDSNVTPNTNTYTGFTAPAEQTVNIDADGSTNVRYEYTRNHYDLKLVAGRGIASVSGTGTVTAGDSAGASGSTTISFLYDEPVTVDFTLKAGYTGGTWSGYEGTSEEFNMKASSGTKTAYATTIVYDITYDMNGGTNDADNPSKYTVESGAINLQKPTGEHTDFLGWTGTDVTGTQENVTIPAGSTGNRTFTAVWKCHTGYHAQTSGDDGKCIADTDTTYTVEHWQQELSGSYIFYESGAGVGTTDTSTSGRNYVNDYEGFTVSSVETGDIKGDKSTVIKIEYSRNSYEGTITDVAGITGAKAEGNHPAAASGEYQYKDTVELSADLEPGYTFSGWTVSGPSGSVTVTNPTSIDGATFVMPAGEVTITPHVTVNDYTITLHKNGGTSADPEVRHYTVESGDINLINPTRDHSTFVGWTGSNGSEAQKPVTVAKGSTGDRDYYAVWDCVAGYHASTNGQSCEANEYTVKIDYNDGDHGSAETTGFTYDTTGTIENPSQSGYDFAGWIVTGITGGNATADGDPITSGSVTSGTEFNNLTTVESGTVTLTATWTPRDDTKYVVKHYTKDLSGTAYTLVDTIEYSGSVAEPVEISSVTGAYSGFTTPNVGYLSGTTAGPSGSGYAQVTIDKHGTTVINLYYSRNSYNVYLSGDAHVDTLVGSGSYPYGAEVSVSATAKTGYHFVRWEKRGENFAKIGSGS